MAKKKKPAGLRLEISVPEGFEPAETQPGEPLTMLNDSIGAAFQISIQPGAAEGENWDDDDLIGFAVQTGAEEGVEPSMTAAEDCEMGRYGMATFSTPEQPVFTIWFLTDGTHVLVATLICSDAPSEEQLQAVWETVHALNLVPA